MHMICLARRQNATNRSFPSGKRCLLLVLRVLLSCGWFLPARRGPQPSRWRQAVSWWLCRLETARTLWVPCRLTDGAYPLRGKSLFCLPSRGQNHFFFCWAKEKAVLDSEKEKGDQWKSWGGALQPDVGFVLLWYPSGEGLWGIPFVSGGLRLSDPWSLLRHCR